MTGSKVVRKGTLRVVALYLVLSGVHAQALEAVTCVLQPKQVAELGSRESGIVESILVEPSAWVDAGDRVLVLDQGLLDIDQRRQQRVIDSLEYRISKNKALADSRLIAADEIDELQTNLDLARLDLMRLSQMQDRLTVRASFSGYVADIYVSPGELVTDQAVVQLIDVRTLRAEMSILDADFGRLRPGDPLRFAFNLVNKEVVGKVISVSPAIDPESNTFRVTAEIDNASGDLAAGMSCRIYSKD